MGKRGFQPKSILERVKGKSEVVGDHWIWQGQKVKRKNGIDTPIMEVRNSKLPVRSCLFREMHGDPTGFVSNVCEEPLCVNPDHLADEQRKGGWNKLTPPDWSFADDPRIMLVIRRGVGSKSRLWRVPFDDLHQEVVLWLAVHSYVWDKGENYAVTAALGSGRTFSKKEWDWDSHNTPLSALEGAENRV